MAKDDADNDDDEKDEGFDESGETEGDTDDNANLDNDEDNDDDNDNDDDDVWQIFNVESAIRSLHFDHFNNDEFSVEFPNNYSVCQKVQN